MQCTRIECQDKIRIMRIADAPGDLNYQVCHCKHVECHAIFFGCRGVYCAKCWESVCFDHAVYTAELDDMVCLNCELATSLSRSEDLAGPHSPPR
jgi:hypothetical protein